MPITPDDRTLIVAETLAHRLTAFGIKNDGSLQNRRVWAQFRVRRTTLEILPSVWFFGDNDDFVGQNLENDPTFELEAHLTRNFTSKFWGSLDATYSSSGDVTIDSMTTSGSDMTLFGFTLGYELNESLALTFGYKSTLNNDAASNDLHMSVFMISLTTGWHRLLEGAGRLSSGG